MIYTVTLNPSLDYVVTLPSFKLGSVNRPEHEAIYPGGKGINVSVMLTRLGFATVALGVTAGFTGEQITRLLGTLGCPHDFVTALAGQSRLSVKILSGEETETEINGRGPVITQEDLSAILLRLRAAGEQDVVVLSGSVPETAPHNACEQVLSYCAQRNVPLVVDITGKRLLEALRFRPFLIKPNIHELCELFGQVIEGEQQIAAYARKLQRQGARHVLVSRGSDGALLVAEDGTILRATPPAGSVQCTVGAGDSMVAGFLAARAQGGDIAAAFTLAVAAGTATAYSPWLAGKEDVYRLAEHVAVI